MEDANSKRSGVFKLTQNTHKRRREDEATTSERVGEGRVLIYIHSDGAHRTASVPVSVIESLPHDVMGIMRRQNGYHEEDIVEFSVRQSKAVWDGEGREEFDYMGLLLGLLGPDYIEDVYFKDIRTSKLRDNEFFSKLKPLEKYYDAFANYYIGGNRPVFDLDQPVTHVFIRDNSCI